MFPQFYPTKIGFSKTGVGVLIPPPSPVEGEDNFFILNIKQEIVKIDDEDHKNNENFCCVCLNGVVIVITRIELLYIFFINSIKL